MRHVVASTERLADNPLMSSWSCPNDAEGTCQLVKGARCEPGMRGCVLHGRFRFARDEGEPAARKPVKAPEPPPRPKRRPSL